jgi:hypothetical protein
MMKTINQALGAALLGAAASTAQAIPFSDLFNGQELIVGDKLFSDWTLNSATISPDLDSDFEDWDLDFSAMEVFGDNSNPMSIVLSFDMGGELFVQDGEVGDLDFSFVVSVISEANEISGVGLEITELNIDGDTFWNYAGIAEGVNDTFDNPTLEVDSGLDVFSDSAAVGPFDSITINKNIFVWSDGPGDSVDLMSFTQTFEQTPVPTPTPLALMALGLFGIGLSRRRS